MRDTRLSCGRKEADRDMNDAIEKNRRFYDCFVAGMIREKFPEYEGRIAVARFRGFRYGALIYGGDDLTGEDWDARSWRSREGVRFDLVQLCAELVSLI